MDIKQINRRKVYKFYLIFVQLQKENGELIRLKSWYIFYTKDNKLWGWNKTKQLGLGAVNGVTATRKHILETSRRFGLFHQVCLYRSILASSPVYWDRNVLLFLVHGRHFSHGKFWDLLLGRKREVGEPSLTLLFLQCNQVKIIVHHSGTFWVARLKASTLRLLAALKFLPGSTRSLWSLKLFKEHLPHTWTFFPTGQQPGLYSLFVEPTEDITVLTSPIVSQPVLRQPWRQSGVGGRILAWESKGPGFKTWLSPFRAPWLGHVISTPCNFSPGTWAW